MKEFRWFKLVRPLVCRKIVFFRTDMTGYHRTHCTWNRKLNQDNCWLVEGRVYIHRHIPELVPVSWETEVSNSLTSSFRAPYSHRFGRPAALSWISMAPSCAPCPCACAQSTIFRRLHSDGCFGSIHMTQMKEKEKWKRVEGKGRRRGRQRRVERAEEWAMFSKKRKMAANLRTIMPISVLSRFSALDNVCLSLSPGTYVLY